MTVLIFSVLLIGKVSPLQGKYISFYLTWLAVDLLFYYTLHIWKKFLIYHLERWQQFICHHATSSSPISVSSYLCHITYPANLKPPWNRSESRMRPSCGEREWVKPSLLCRNDTKPPDERRPENPAQRGPRGGGVAGYEIQAQDLFCSAWEITADGFIKIKLIFSLKNT